MMASLLLRTGVLAIVFSLSTMPMRAASPEDPLVLSAERALAAAGDYAANHLGILGTYVWQYSLDGVVRRGEGGIVSPTVGWVQPPGTPAVGAAFLRIFEVTGDRRWLDAAAEVATALTRTQLLSGGWFYLIETDPGERRSWCYRADVLRSACRRIKDNPNRNKTVLDDNNTQSVLNFLMWFDQASGHADPKVAGAIQFGLKRIMRMQYPNGAVPVFFDATQPGENVVSATKASLPETWSQEWQKPLTPPYFIVNDDLPRDTGRMFLNAYHLYGDTKYRDAALRMGEFLLSAQLPAPQTGWAQQYDRTMQPVWGRIFEPPALVSRETAGSIDFLIDLFVETGERKYLAAATLAADWLKTSRLPDGTWSRYYEIGSNRPMYVDNNNRVVFEPINLLDHYGTRGTFDIPQVLRRLDQANSGSTVAPSPLWIYPTDDLSETELAANVKGLITRQDPSGRWVVDGWVDGATFVDAVFALSQFLTEAEAAP
jgi:hypothetical protein